MQSVHGAHGVSVHTGFAWNMRAACGERAKSVSREGVCSACTKHTLSVHGVCERVCTKRAAERAQSTRKSEPAVLAQGTRGACSECAKSACGARGKSEHRAAEHAWSVHTHAGSTHTARPATVRAHACARERCPPAVAHPPCVERDTHWHTSSPKGTHASGSLNRGLPPAPQLPSCNVPQMWAGSPGPSIAPSPR